jgi:hypothetical protein
VLLEQLLVDARVVVEAVEVGLRGEDAEVGVALLVLGEEDEVVAPPSRSGPCAPLVPAT